MTGEILHGQHNSNGSGIFKWTTSFLAGVVVTGVMAYVAGQKDLITRREYTEQNLRVEQHLEAHDRAIDESVKNIEKDMNEITRLQEDLKMLEKKRNQ